MLNVLQKAKNYFISKNLKIKLFEGKKINTKNKTSLKP